MGRIRNQLLKVIEWTDASNDTLAYKFVMPPNAEIMNGSALTVSPSQVAIFVHKGKVADVFTEGYYKLETANLPFLTKMMSWKYAFETPFRAEVYFINVKQFPSQKWGTSNPVMMRDQDFGMVQFRGFGNFTFRVDHTGDGPEKFLRELMGTNPIYKVGNIIDQLKRTIVSGVTEAVAASNIPALDLAMKYSSLGESTINIVRAKFLNMGLYLVSLDIENLSLTEEATKAMEMRTRMNVIGDANQYTQFQAADSMRDIAQNAHKGTGGMGNIPAMGMGLGTGFAMTNMYAGTIAGAQANAQANAQAANQAAAQASQPVACPKCGRANAQNAKFCLECGQAMQATCPKCGHSIKSAAKFCPECGAPIGAPPPACPKCKKVAKPGTRFCEDCGTKLD